MRTIVLGLALGLILAATLAAQVPSYTLETFAGVNPLLDNTTTPFVRLFEPEAVGADRAGNIYIGDTGGRRVWKIDPQGRATILLGNGINDYSGDGGAGNKAGIRQPSGIVVDAAGNVYVSDRDNARVRKIDPTGKVTTFAGFGGGRFTGDGRPAVNSAVNATRGLAIDSAGNIYIADTSNHRIRKVDPSGIMTTVAGSTGSGFAGDRGSARRARLNAPEDVAVDKNGNVFIADTGNNRIRMVTPAGVITTIAGTDAVYRRVVSGNNVLTRRINSAGDGGPAVNAQVWAPACILVDGSGNVIFGERSQSTNDTNVGTSARLRKIDMSTGIISGLVTLGANPGRMALEPSGSILIPETTAHRVRRYDPASNRISFVVGAPHYGGDGLDKSQAVFNKPYGIVLDGAGNVYVSDTGNNRVRKIDAAGLVTTIAGLGTTGFSTSADEGVPAVQARVNSPRGLALDAAGNLYIADSGNNRIRKIDMASGIITTVAGGGSLGDGFPATSAALSNPYDVALDTYGNMYIAEFGAHCIRKVGVDGIIHTIVGTRGTSGISGDGDVLSEALLNNPAAVKVDPTGLKIWIADRANHSVRFVDVVGGMMYSVAGVTGAGDRDAGPDFGYKLRHRLISGIALDSKGNLLVADNNNHRVRWVAAADLKETEVAGNGPNGPTETPIGLNFAGDGGAATSGRMAHPVHLAVDADGKVYVVENGNDIIRRLIPK